jgi:hypothetical protein
MPVLLELPAELPVVVPPLVDDPGVVPLGEGLPTEPVPPVEPVPVCAIANVLAKVSAAANPRVPSFMIVIPFQLRTEETVARGYVPAPTSTGCDEVYPSR